MIRQELINLIREATKAANLDGQDFSVEHSEDKMYGDYATNVALKLARIFKMPPLKIAESLKPRISHTGADLLDRIEIVEPGFINFFISKKYLQNQVSEILKQKESFGGLKLGKGQKVNVESISANPTGPLHIGNGRNAFYGDALANVLKKADYKVTREYFINNAKNSKQITELGKTALGRGRVYLTDYLEEKIKILESKLKKCKNEGDAGFLLAGEVQKDIKNFLEKKLMVRFDKRVSEQEDIYGKNKVGKILDWLKKNDLAYEKDKALWLKTSSFGDEKDWVILRETGEPTYLLSDIAYHKDKFDRGFDKVIDIWGADHQAHVSKMEAAWRILCHKGDFALQNLGSLRVGKQAFDEVKNVRNHGFLKEGGRGEPCDRDLDILVLQLVALRGGEKMSKRAGNIITLEELVDEIGLDVARWFYLQKSLDTHMEIDLELAKEQSEKNPVFYVQYAHARICSILAKSKAKSQRSKVNLLNHPSELNLISQLIILPEVIEDTANDYQIQRLPQYATGLAAAFHQFYRDCQVISENRSLSEARLALVLATKIVLKNTLSLMGISAPEKM